MRVVMLASGLGLALALAAPVARATAIFTSLGPLTGVSGVSADGSTVVGIRPAGSGNEAFHWTAGTGFVGLGFLPGGSSSHAFAVSADGSVVVGEAATTLQGSYRAFRWTAPTGMVALGSLPGDAAAFDVSADGSVIVGGTSELFGPTLGEAFRWTAGSGMVSLGALPGATETLANAVSGDGSVVVGHSAAPGSSQAFLWTETSGMVSLGLPGTESDAYDVSAHGSVVVGAFDEVAYRWTEAGGAVSLGVLPGNGFSEALAVSADGSYVVGDSGNPGLDEAFIWDAANGMRSIQELLTNVYGVDLAGWHLVSAVGISADGRTIVGNARDPGGADVGWIAVIPEPTTGVLVMVGLAGIALGRRASH